MTRLIGEHNMVKVLLDNRVIRRVLKNETTVFNIRAVRKVSIGGIDGSQSTFLVCCIPNVGVGFFNENAVATIISWFKCIKLGMDPNYLKE